MYSREQTLHYIISYKQKKTVTSAFNDYKICIKFPIIHCRTKPCSSIFNVTLILYLLLFSGA